MNDKDKKKIKDAAAAMAPALKILNNVYTLASGLREQEDTELSEAEDQDSDEMTQRRDALEALSEAVDRLGEYIDELEGVKAEMEEF